MRLTDKQAKKLRGIVWADYSRGYPWLDESQIPSNNWRRIHRLPLIRRK